MSDNVVGAGVYTPAEAAPLLQLSVSSGARNRPSRQLSGRLRRWMSGYSVRGEMYAPLWSPDFMDADSDKLYFSFRDLMELRAVMLFVDAGVSLQAIRKSIFRAKEIIKSERPLSTTQFRTDGRTIFLEIAKEEGDPQLYDLIRRQYAFQRIVALSFKDVEFEGIMPVRWWPASTKSGIVVDPARSFGQPVDDQTGVPIEILANAAQTNGGVEAAAKWWRVPAENIRRAVDFQHALEAQAA